MLCLLSVIAATAQQKYITHDMMMPSDQVFPFFDGHFVWWNDSTVTYVSYYQDRDSVRTSWRRIDFLMRDDLETHRRLDSLISELNWHSYQAINDTICSRLAPTRSKPKAKITLKTHP